MSNFNHLKSYALGSHNWFFPKGAAFTSPGAGTVAVDAWPDSAEPTFDDRFVGDCEDWSAKKNVDSEEIFRPNPGVLVRKDIITFFQSLDFEITVNSLSRIALQVMFGSAVELEEEVGEFVPLAAEPVEGLWIAQKYTQQNEKVFVANFWARVDVTDIASGNKKLVKPKFMVKMLDSELNSMFFGKPELLGS
ncbi:MAG: hypothetical protein HC901_00360 [Bdellovibrionaceae bacterium]|nr:hypothetical protein [Pseudobdellovibrionaceae bacterium]